MKKIVQPVLLAFVILTVLLSSCTPASTLVPPTFTPLPTNTPLPTDTPSPTNTLVPTNTSVPTKTPIVSTATIPAPDKSLEYLDGVKIVYFNPFDKQLASTKWYYDSEPQITNGVLEILGKNWNGIAPLRQFTEGSGIIVDFTYTEGAVFQTYMSKGQSLDDVDYKAFAIYFEENLVKANVWAGKNSLGGENLSGNFALQPNTNYSLLAALILNGEFLMVIWEKSDPSKTIYYHEKIGKNWSNLTWGFGIAVDRGSLVLDNYREIKFDSAK